MKLTATIAYATAQDAGTRSMRAAGRQKWNEDDFNAATAELARLWPAIEAQPPARELAAAC